MVLITLLRQSDYDPCRKQTGDVTITGDDDLIDEADETVIVDITGVTNGTDDLSSNRPLLLPMMMQHRLCL